MPVLKPQLGTPAFTKITEQIGITFYEFDLTRCDERTFYITISLEYKNLKEICDLIFLVDKEELYGAISLNNRYENAQNFFLKHFNYPMLYTDELFIASLTSSTKKFKECFKLYAQQYPKYTAIK